MSYESTLGGSMMLAPKGFDVMHHEPVMQSTNAWTDTSQTIRDLTTTTDANPLVMGAIIVGVIAAAGIGGSLLWKRFR